MFELIAQYPLLAAMLALVGLGAVTTIWLAWVIFGWVPIAGQLIQGAAILITWLLGTAGFGAALLSRAGAREQFSGRLLPPEAMTRNGSVPRRVHHASRKKSLFIDSPPEPLGL